MAKGQRRGEGSNPAAALKASLAPSTMKDRMLAVLTVFLNNK